MATIPSWIPQIGMTFSSCDEAWDFWVTYGGRMGFDVRKCYSNKSELDGRDIVENTKLDAALRYKNLGHIFRQLALRASDFEDCYLLVEEGLYSLSKQVEEKIRESPNTNAENVSVQAPFSLPENFSNVAGLKKKEKKNGGSKRNKKLDREIYEEKEKQSKQERKKSKPHHEESENFVPELQRHEKNKEPASEGYPVYDSLASFTQLIMSSNVQSVSNLQSFEGLDGWQF